MDTLTTCFRAAVRPRFMDGPFADVLGDEGMKDIRLSSCVLIPNDSVLESGGTSAPTQIPTLIPTHLNGVCGSMGDRMRFDASRASLW